MQRVYNCVVFIYVLYIAVEVGELVKYAAVSVVCYFVCPLS